MDTIIKAILQLINNSNFRKAYTRIINKFDKPIKLIEIKVYQKETLKEF